MWAKVIEDEIIEVTSHIVAVLMAIARTLAFSLGEFHHKNKYSVFTKNIMSLIEEGGGLSVKLCKQKTSHFYLNLFYHLPSSPLNSHWYKHLTVMLIYEISPTHI